MGTFLNKAGLQVLWTKIKTRYDANISHLLSSLSALSPLVSSNTQAIQNLQSSISEAEGDIVDIRSRADTAYVLAEEAKRGNLIPVVLDAVLTAGGWSNNQQSINNGNIPDPNASYLGLIGPNLTASNAEKEAFYKAGIYLVSQTVGVATYRCFGTVPTININVSLEVLKYA